MSLTNRLIAITEFIPVIGTFVAMALAFRLAVPGATGKPETAALIAVVLFASYGVGVGLTTWLEGGGNSRTNRGQLTSQHHVPILIAVVVVGVVVNGLATIDNIKPNADVNHLCKGIWGCGGPQSLDVVAPALLVVGLTVLISAAARWRLKEPRGGAE